MAGSRHKQLDIDWPRYRQLAVLRDARLTIGLKAVLRGIDDFGRGGEAWPSQLRLAQVCGCSPRTLRRHLVTLESMSLICRERKRLHEGRGGAHHIYTIVWTELALLVDEGDERETACDHDDQADMPGHLVERDLVAKSDDLVAKSDDLVATVGHYSRSATRSAPEAQIKNNPPPPNGSATRAAADMRGVSQSQESTTAVAEHPVDAIRVELAAAGLDKHRQLAWEMYRRGIGPEEVRTVCREFAANRSRFSSPGAIIDRLRSGAWPAAGVVPIESIERQRIERTRAERAEEVARRATERQAAERLAALEAAHGAALDRLDAEARYELLAAANEFAARLMRQNPQADYRRQLLEALEARKRAP